MLVMEDDVSLKCEECEDPGVNLVSFVSGTGKKFRVCYKCLSNAINALVVSNEAVALQQGIPVNGRQRKAIVEWVAPRIDRRVRKGGK